MEPAMTGTWEEQAVFRVMPTESLTPAAGHPEWAMVRIIQAAIQPLHLHPIPFAPIHLPLYLPSFALIHPTPFAPTATAPQLFLTEHKHRAVLQPSQTVIAVTGLIPT